MYSCGIDIGGTKVMIGFVDQNRKLVFSQKYLIPAEMKKEGFLNWLTETFSFAANEAEIDQDEISFCGMGVPGSVSQDGKIVLQAPNLGWENIPLADAFQRITGIPAKLIQDSRAGAWGEYVAGAGQGYKNVICITLGTGIGTGIVLDGKIFDGSLLCAGEIGHTPMGNKGRLCGCGKEDCLEKYAAGLGLTITAQELYGSEATSETLFYHGEQGDALALKALNEAVHMLGVTLVTVVNLLSPDCLLFSGGLSLQRKLYVDPLIKYVREHSYHLTSRQMHIGIAQLSECAPMIGCALLPH